MQQKSGATGIQVTQGIFNRKQRTTLNSVFVIMKPKFSTIIQG